MLERKAHVYVTTQINVLVIFQRYISQDTYKIIHLQSQFFLFSYTKDSLSCKPQCPFSSYFIMLSSISQVQPCNALHKWVVCTDKNIIMLGFPVETKQQLCRHYTVVLKYSLF